MSQDTNQPAAPDTANPIPQLEETNGTRNFAIFLLVLSVAAAIGAGNLFRTLTSPAGLPFANYSFNLTAALYAFGSGAVLSAAFFTASAIVARLNRIIALLKQK